jgi:hypothetical protein
MRKKNKKCIRWKIVLRLPDLDYAKAAVLNSLSSPQSRRNYRFAMEQFITWYCSEPNRSASVSSPSRITWAGGRHDQPKARRGQASCLRSG